MGQYYNPVISSPDTLALNMDAANARSYAGSGNTWFDLSAFSNSGALNSCTFAGSSGTAAIVFNGSSSQYLGVINGGNVTTSWTCEAWIFPVGFGGTNVGRIFQHSIGNLSGFIFALDNNAVSAGLQLNTYAISGFSARIGNCITLNTWQQVALSFSSGTATFYVNGVSIGSSSINSPLSHFGNSAVGNNLVASNAFDGRISIFRLYRNTLTAAEVLQNFNAHRSRYGI
jgi:hypothetical protein